MQRRQEFLHSTVNLSFCLLFLNFCAAFQNFKIFYGFLWILTKIKSSARISLTVIKQFFLTSNKPDPNKQPDFSQRIFEGKPNKLILHPPAKSKLSITHPKNAEASSYFPVQKPTKNLAFTKSRSCFWQKQNKKESMFQQRSKHATKKTHQNDQTQPS